MNTDTIEQAAHSVFADAARALGNSDHSRIQAAVALIDAAKSRGLSGVELQFVASCGMAWFGYGGGL